MGVLRDVQEPIFVFVLLIDAVHERGRWWEDFVDEDEDGLFGGELDALADHIDKLSNSEVARHQVFLLVDGRDI